jgi:tetratricopeptide (TPR) repeat protein
MNAGVDAYKSAKYEAAIAHFRKATTLDPNLAVAHIYLGSAYAQMYIPGDESADNLQHAENSLAEFKKVLEFSPWQDQRISSLKGLASLNFNLKRYDDARQCYQQIIELDPQDPESYYSLAVIDWTEAYEPRMLHQSMGLKPTELITSVSACNLLRSMNQEKVEDGIRALHKAIDIRCDYEDAMAYMNLLYREKADYECDDPVAREADLKRADEWVDRTMAVKKDKAEKTAAAH